MSEEARMLLGLAVGIILMIVLVLKTKTHTFIALLFAAAVTGIIGGMSIVNVTLDDGTVKTGLITAITDGFGNTLRSTGIIIGLGVMMGGVLEKTGAAERLAYTFIKLIGKGKEEWALGITGWIVSIPVFADSALVIFRPLTNALSRVTGKSVIGLALALACGLQCTHTMVPPTPGPTASAEMMGVDIGQMILFGAALSIPILIASILYSKWIGRKIYQIPKTDGSYDRKEFKKEYIKKMDELDAIMDVKNLPKLWPSVAPIVIPLALIFMNTGLGLFNLQDGGSVSVFIYNVISFLGAPVVALSIGTMLAVYGLGKKIPQKEIINIMNNSIKDTGIIMLITGAGGALGNVVKVSGIGTVLGEMVVGWPIPAILIPVIIAALMRIALGSATVAITTAASLTAPLVPMLGITPVILAQASCIGAFSFGYFNDSGFWVFNGMFGLTEMKDQLKCKTAVSMIMAGVGVVELLILNMFI